MGEAEKMIWAILGLGLILRLISLNQSLWLDEAINILAAKNYSLVSLITQYAKADFHPPGHFIILWFWGRLFGFSEIAMRMPSVIFGLLTIFLIYLIGKKLVSENLGLIAAILLAVNPLHIYYSQEARMYAFAAFATALNFYYFLDILSGTASRWKLVIGNVLVFMSDYLAYLIIPAQFVVILFAKKVQFLKSWFVSLIIAAIFFIWWMPIFLEQFNVGKMAAATVPGWKLIAGDSGIKSLMLTYVKFIIGRISHSDLLIYSLFFLPVGILFAFLILRGLKKTFRLNRVLLSIWIAIPILSAWLISFFVPIYSYFRLLFVLPAFILLVALGISTLKVNFKSLFLSLAIVTQVISSSIYLFNPAFQREDWRGLVNFLKSLETKDSEVLFESNGSFAPFDYYGGNDVKGIGALKKFPADNNSDLIDLQITLENVSDVYLIDYLVEISDSNRLVGKKLLELNYKKADIKNFNGIGFVYHYVK